MNDELSPPAIFGEAEAGRAFSVRKQLLVLTQDIKERTFDLAELLAEASSGSMFVQWGYASLGEYSEQELGIKERKSQYLVRILKVCKAVGLQRKDFEKVGISKLRDITTLDPEGSFWNTETKESESLDEHIVRLITEAEDMTKDEVTEEILRLKGMTGGDRPVVRSFSMSSDTWNNIVKVAFERVRMHLGSSGRDAEGKAVEYSDGTCLEMLAAEYLAGDEPEEIPIPMEEI